MKQFLWVLIRVLLLSGLGLTVLAQTPLTPQAQYAADSQQAQARYRADKKLCNDETSSNARLQCRRDAKTEYDKSSAAAKAHLAAVAPVSAEPSEVKMACADCGRVIAVSSREKAGEGGAVGIIAGGATGAVIGHQVGGGLGKDLATIAGAVGGAYAGKKIEEKVKTHKVWIVSVHYANGSKRSFEFNRAPGLRVGDPVKNSGKSIVRY